MTFAADTGKGLEPPQLPEPVEPADLATLFSLAFPKASAPVGRIGFRVKVAEAGPVVDRQ